MVNIRRYLARAEIRYILIGIVNTLFGYLFGGVLYIILINKINFIYILIFVNIISITFSFITYRKYVFKSNGKWLEEYLRCYMVYGVGALLGSAIVWFLVQKADISIWFAQAVAIIFVALASYIGHKKFTFR